MHVIYGVVHGERNLGRQPHFESHENYLTRIIIAVQRVNRLSGANRKAPLALQ